MARSLLAVAAAAIFATGAAWADPTPSPTPQDGAPSSEGRHSKKDRDGDRPDRDGDRGPRAGDSDHRPPPDGQGQPPARFRKPLDSLTPEERQHFQENFQRWQQMGENERRDWQERAAKERERIRKIIDETIAKLGLTLDADQREVFVLRYRQERRKIEEKLCQEMDAKRQAQVADMLQRLKAEFSAPKPTPAPSPAATPQ